MSKAISMKRKTIDLGAFGKITGYDSGYNQASDVLVERTVDGVSYADMYREFQETIALQNSERTAIVDFLTFPTVEAFESVSQLSGTRFERATEYGEPRGARLKPTSFLLGFDFDSYDVGVRYTYQFLSNATAQQAEALHASVLEADNQLMFEKVLEAIYNNQNRSAEIMDRPVNVYALYNADGTVPPAYKSNVFDGTHNHYMTSGDTVVDSGDVEDLIQNVTEHGYSSGNGVQLVLAVNSREGKVIRNFRISNGDNYDFIPSQGSGTQLILDPGQTITGGQPSSFYRGLPVIGSYGEALVIEDDNFPPGYMLVVGTGGRANLNNPVGLREHTDPSQRGLRLIRGPQIDYPLTDSFYLRAFGTGIRQRGGSAVMQITASPTYSPPAQYVYPR